MLEVHELRPDVAERTAADWAATVMAAVPYLLAAPASVRHELPTSPHAVAVEDGRPVGVARLRDHVAHDGTCSVLVGVLPAARGHGAGDALLDWAVRRSATLGTATLTGVVDDDGRSPDVLAHWGFTLGDRHPMSWVDSRTIGAGVGPLPDPGLALVRVDEVDPRRLWECHQLAAPDDPSGFTRQVSLEDYLRDEWSDPLLRHDLGRAVLDGDRVVAFALMRAAGDRGWSSMTATAPSHRGRGLSLVVKAAALRAAAAAGVHRCATANAGTNTAVLALNARLGYAPLCTVRSVVRRPEQASSP